MRQRYEKFKARNSQVSGREVIDTEDVGALAGSLGSNLGGNSLRVRNLYVSTTRLLSTS